MSTSVWKAIPIVGTIDAQNEDECIAIFADDDDITLTERGVGSLLQDVSIGDKGDEE